MSPLTDSVQVNYTRTIEDTFWFKPGRTYIVEYAQDRKVTGRFIGLDQGSLIFREGGSKARLISVRVKSLRAAKLL